MTETVFRENTAALASVGVIVNCMLASGIGELFGSKTVIENRLSLWLSTGTSLTEVFPNDRDLA